MMATFDDVERALLSGEIEHARYIYHEYMYNLRRGDEISADKYACQRSMSPESIDAQMWEHIKAQLMHTMINNLVREGKLKEVTNLEYRWFIDFGEEWLPPWRRCITLKLAFRLSHPVYQRLEFAPMPPIVERMTPRQMVVALVGIAKSAIKNRFNGVTTMKEIEEYSE